jgi:hypothetical protein
MLQYNPQPTQPCDNAPVAIVVGINSSAYGNVNSDNGVGDSVDNVDGGGNGSGMAVALTMVTAAMAAVATKRWWQQQWQRVQITINLKRQWKKWRSWWQG